MLPNPHPGEILREEFLKPAVDGDASADAVAVSPERIADIVDGKCEMTSKLGDISHYLQGL
ncbi:hypothetical protein AJ87_17805 [Rhizobium yanglingense]|nr:hypothetical protein AJ87_17805 [Rhizobium yanglingense]